MRLDERVLREDAQRCAVPVCRRYLVTMRVLRMVLFALGSVAAWPAAASACLCMRTPYVCEQMSLADAVFEATVEAIEPDVTAGQPPLGRNAASGSFFGFAPLRVRLRDVRAWRGDAPASVVTAASGASCGYTFEVNRRYLIVADRRVPGGPYSVSLCGQTRPLPADADLVEYLRSAVGASSVTRVFGTVRRPADLPGARVIAVGPVTREVTIAADGSYVFRDLPFGRAYNVAVSLPVDATNLEAPKPVPFDLRGASPCAMIDFFVSKRTRLWGLVTDLQGRPAAGVFVLATPAAVKRMTGGRPGGATQTDEKGRYEFMGLPPGRYIIVLQGRSGEPKVRSNEVDLLPGGEVTMPVLRLHR